MEAKTETVFAWTEMCDILAKNLNMKDTQSEFSARLFTDLCSRFLSVFQDKETRRNNSEQCFRREPLHSFMFLFYIFST